jgi:hypothetical protein
MQPNDFFQERRKSFPLLMQKWMWLVQEDSAKWTADTTLEMSPEWNCRRFAKEQR